MRHYSYLTKMTVFGCILCTLPIVFFGLFSYMQSSQVIQKQANRAQAQLLAQMNANVEQILLSVYHALNQLSDSTVMSEVMDQQLEPSNFKLYNDLRQEISNAESSYTKVDDIVVINFKQNWMVKNSGFYRYDQYLHHSQISNQLMLPNSINWVLNPSIWFYSEETANSVRCPYTISLVKKLPAQSLDKYGLAIANISTCSLSDMVKYTPGDNEKVMIIDDLNRIMYDSDPSMIGKYANNSGFISDTLLLKEPSGQYQVEVNHETYTVTYRRSSFNNWIYMSVISIDSLTREAKKIERYTILACLIIVAIFLVFAWVGSRRMYSPIQQLVRQFGGFGSFGGKSPRPQEPRINEFDFIRDKLQDLFSSNTRLEQQAFGHLQQALTFFLIKMFQGNLRRKDLEEKLEQFSLNTKLAGWRVMGVITLQIDSLENTRYGKDDLELLLFAINNIVQEIIPDEVRFPPLSLDHTTVVLIGGTVEQQPDFSGYLYSLTESIQSTVKQVLNLQISIGISLPFNDPKNASVAYVEGLEALKHRFHLGEGVIIQFSNINEGKHRLQMTYPGLTESEMLDAIALAEEEKARDLLHQFMQTVLMQELSPQEYQLPMFRMLNNLLVFMQQSGVALTELTSGDGSYYGELNKLTIAAEIEDWFWSRLIGPMLRIFRERQNSQYQNISEKIIDMIRKHFDSELTIEHCAAELNYNANYISGVFRKETGITFSDYLSTHRLNMAKKWLTESDMTVKEIAEKLQYMNSQNFIRSFRKQEGMTPGQFRSMHSKPA